MNNGLIGGVQWQRELCEKSLMQLINICPSLFICWSFVDDLAANRRKWWMWERNTRRWQKWDSVVKPNEDQLLKIARSWIFTIPVFPFLFFLADDCPAHQHHLLLSTYPEGSLWLENNFHCCGYLVTGFSFLLLLLLPVKSYLIVLPPHASLMSLCRCRCSRPEAQPADGAEPPAGGGGTCRSAFRGKKKNKNKPPKLC